MTTGLLYTPPTHLFLFEIQNKFFLHFDLDGWPHNTFAAITFQSVFFLITSTSSMSAPRFSGAAPYTKIHQLFQQSTIKVDHS